LRVGSECHPVTVLKEGPPFTAWQPNRLGALPHFKQATFRAFFRAGDGAGSEKIARTEIAAVARVMGDEL